MKTFKSLFSWLIGLGVRGTASDKVSTAYTNFITNKAPPAATDMYGRMVPIHVKHIVVSGETVSGTVKLGVHPKGWAFAGLQIGSSVALSASAGVGQTPVIGDGSTANKYMLASDFDAVTGVGLVNGASLGYIPTADKVITLTYGATGTPVVAGVIEGYLFFIPGS
jgi:hypothetical protein